jgi:hypothetical protein
MTTLQRQRILYLFYLLKGWVKQWVAPSPAHIYIYIYIYIYIDLINKRDSITRLWYERKRFTSKLNDTMLINKYIITYNDENKMFI